MSRQQRNSREAARNLFRPGDNCWGQCRADRFGWLIDGEEYFRALRESLEQARREILIVGWDIDSRVELIRDESHELYPSPLAKTLEDLASRNDGLRIRVLSWDFSMIYVLERELLPAAQFGWRDSERLNFRLDGSCPTGASHHQKFVVVDGAVAFIGGIDLTKNRWDTRKHAAADPRRVDPDGTSYRPFHDVQAIVSGEPARRLRELAASRWEEAGGESLDDIHEDRDAVTRCWPESATVQGRDVPTCLARTRLRANGEPEVEVERLFIDMIGAARRSIYIENQYFTSDAIADALCRRLREAEGPEVFIVLPAETSGWLEQATMDVLRDRAIARLRDADEYGRLQIVSPVSEELGDVTINVHAKVMIVDDRWLRIGSANLSRRSMRLDSECDLVVEDPDEILAARFRSELLAEHLGCPVAELSEQSQDARLSSLLDQHAGGQRRLEPLETRGHDWQRLLAPVAQIADLERPVGRTLEEATADASAAGRRPAWLAPLYHPALRWALVAAAVAATSAFLLWRGGFQGADFDLNEVIARLRAGVTHPAAALGIVPAFVAGSLVVMPVTLMIALTAVLFSPVLSSAGAICGILAATAVNHALGKLVAEAVAGSMPQGLSDKLDALGQYSDIWSLAGLRLVPIAPFSVVNVLAGASRVPLRDFLLGTLIGMGPGVVLICLSVDRARAALAGEPIFEPWLVGTLVAAGLLLIVLRLRYRKRSS